MEREKNKILDDEIVKVTKMGHITEIQYMQKSNNEVHIKKISKTQYVDIKTGELKNFKLSENRSENVNSLYQTFKKLRYLINNNFSGRKNEFFVTLTFAPDERGWRPSLNDTEHLAYCWKMFQRRLKRKFGAFEFIRVIEPHADGKAHYHALFKFSEDLTYIDSDVLTNLWGNGFVKIHTIKNVDNIGAYVSAYLADIELTEQTGLDEMMSGNTTEILEKEGKKFIKGGRLKYYPTGKQIYNKSKGIIEPERTNMFYEDAKKIAGSTKPTFASIKKIKKDDFENTIIFESYNSKRL